MRKKSKPKLKRHQILGIIFWTVVAVVAISIIISQEIKINKSKAEFAALDESVSVMEERATELDETIEVFKNDEDGNVDLSDEFIEDIARDTLDYVRSDEVIFKEAE